VTTTGIKWNAGAAASVSAVIDAIPDAPDGPSGLDREHAGVTPAVAGLYQINIRLPLSIPNGNQPVQMTIGGIASPSGGYIAVSQ